MRAVRIVAPGGPEALRVEEVSDPVPGPDDLLVRVRAAGVNRADLLQRRGRYPAPPGAPSDVPGLEIAGEVEVVGARAAETAGFSGGERVMALLPGGGYAERAVVPAGMAIPVPAGVSMEEAGGVPEVFLTAHDALFHRGRLRAGERVLVHAAAGGVGTAALQLARAAGAAWICGTASAPKLEAVRALGLPLDAGVDYRSESFRDLVRRETGGRGVDVILDTVGGPYWEDNVASLAPLGRFVLVGVLGGAEARADLGLLMRRRVTVVGTVLRSRPLDEKLPLAREFRERLLPLFEAGALRPVLDRSFPLEAAPEAHRYLEENRSVGKVVLTIGRPASSAGTERTSNRAKATAPGERSGLEDR